MKKSLSRFAFITLMLCISLFFSCSSSDSDSPNSNQGQNNSEEQDDDCYVGSDFYEIGYVFDNSIQKQSGNFVAQSGFYSDPDGNQNYICALIGDVDVCGSDLIDNGFKVDFFMIDNARIDTIWLSPKPSYARNGDRAKDCSGSGNNFTCFGSGNGKGIEVKEAAYQCGGKRQCEGNAIAIANVNLVGNYNIYARLVGQDGKPDANSESILIDSFMSSTNTRIVWGDLESEFDGRKITLMNAYGEKTSRNQTIIAGKRTPIYITSGSGWDYDYNLFFYDNDPDIAGKGYTLAVEPVGLKLYNRENGYEEKRSGVLGRSGVDTIWVEGGYDLENNTKFTLNVVAESDDAPSMTLTIYQPKLKFVENDFRTTVGNPSGYARWTNGDSYPPYIGWPLDIYAVAWDDMRNMICEHCSFPLTETSTAIGNCPDNVKKNKYLFETISPARINTGKLEIIGYGQEDTGDASCTVSWKITGPNPAITAEWTGLRFRETPLPIPMESYIYDRNGDGIGDSVIVKYNRSLATNDSLLPVLLEIVWEPGDTVYYHNQDYKTSDLKNKDFVKNIFDKSFYAKNRSYWNNFVKDNSIVIAKSDTKFSKNILTSGRGTVISHTPFKETDGNSSTFNYGAYSAVLLDRISPIVVAARYDYVTPGCVVDANNKCSELIIVTLSEKVYKAENSSDDAYKNPFNYCLRSQNRNCAAKIADADRYSDTWDNIDWSWELPEGENVAVIARYNNSGTNRGLTEGDSIVYLTYKSYRPGVNLNPTPKAGDWVKVRIHSEGDVFADAEGNLANPNERGVLIKGTCPSRGPTHVGKLK